MLDNLEHSKNIESCQWACQINPACNYFTFSKDKNVCILHRMDVRHRVCDIIHGPPVPSLQSCLNDNAIPWASSSGDNLEHITTNFIFFEINAQMLLLNIFVLITISGLKVFVPSASTPATGKSKIRRDLQDYIDIY